ncbi:MAG TPA: MGMT family protein [Intrasporangium sp.]|uniref:MGMT family protein n=1 Tax=Intrasporangium sp. TaxID=1925024 RepID=UPI002D78FBE3|nr:MGMT family protein [Intrasporangium sp.]HET7399604.1 MGMT family protein [Intrasporangium sp.]
MPSEEYAERVLDLVRLIPPGRVLAYGDVARRLGEGGARMVGTVLRRYGSGAPWWRVIRADGRPPPGLEREAVEHWRAEGTPLARGLVDGSRADMARARWSGEATGGDAEAVPGTLHHVEVWVEDIATAGREWGWLLGRLGYRLGDDWGHGQAWELGSLYVVLEAGPDVLPGRHERRRAGVNHLAFHGGSRQAVTQLVEECAEHGWTLMFPEQHPYAGGPGRWAAYLESGEGFEVELVAG